MENEKRLYRSVFNPILLKPARPLPREMAVIGAGTIGPDIGYYLKSALPEATLHLVDIAEKPLATAKQRLEGYAAKAVDRGKMKPAAAQAVLENISYTTNYQDLKNCSLVIEAATEDIPLKQRIFLEVEKIVSPEAIITSNTSSIPADRLFSSLEHPERTTVTHFFAPAWRSLPVEVITWDKADPEVIDYLSWFFVRTGKAPLITDNVICFMLDRIFDNWCNESAILLSEAQAGQIDSAAGEFVFAGPFFVLNMANGNPIIIEANTLQMGEGEQYRPASIFASVDRWKTGRPGAKVEIPTDLAARIRDRLLGILFSQSFDIVDRTIGTRADLDFGCQVALGFKKGPLEVMKGLGQAEVGRIMDEFEKNRPGFPKPAQPFSAYQDFYRHVLVDDLDRVKVITIRRPQAMNALSDEITGEILSVLKAHEADPAVDGFIITGYGTQAFSAGADIGKFPSMLGDAQASAQYSRDCAQVQVYIDQMEKPVVAALNGLALGGGLEVAIRCHGLVAMSKARLGFPEITLGILPGIGGCVVPYRRWPRGAALFDEMICLGRTITAAEALETGLISQVVDDLGDLMPAALAEIKRLRNNIPRLSDEPISLPEFKLPDEPKSGQTVLSREAVALTLEITREAAASASLAEALEIGYKGFGRIACLEAAREGIGAFLEKRKPDFKK